MRNYSHEPQLVPATVMVQTDLVSYTVKIAEDIVWKRHSDQLPPESSLPQEASLVSNGGGGPLELCHPTMHTDNHDTLCVVDPHLAKATLP